MFRDPEAPESSVLFLANWELEVRAGFTPAEELDVVLRLKEDYLNPDETPELEARLIAEATVASDHLLRAAREQESQWPSVTPNDRLSAAFSRLGDNGIFAQECCGTTIQDGWGYVGLGASPKQRGAVFYHQEDVFDALEGKSLLLAFGGCGPGPSESARDSAIATEVLEVLGRHGLPAHWSGRVEDRIVLAPFGWQRRRWTQPSGSADGTAVTWTRTPPFARPSIADGARLKYEQPIVARRTSFAFDRWLSTIMRGAWTHLGGERGQFGHTGDPHVFLPAGELTTVAPQDALRNLAAEESASIRSRAIATKRRWWKIW